MLFKLEGDDPGMAELDALPDVEGWQYGGTEQLGSKLAQVWVYEAR